MILVTFVIGACLLQNTCTHGDDHFHMKSKVKLGKTEDGHVKVRYKNDGDHWRKDVPLPRIPRPKELLDEELTENDVTVSRDPSIDLASTPTWDEAVYKDVPYVVSVVVNGSRACVGTLVSDTHVLTTGICAAPLSNFSVVIGDFKLNGVSMGRTILVNETTIRRDYGAISWPTTVGVLRLAEPVDPAIKPVRMAPRATERRGENCVVVGFGTLRLKNGTYVEQSVLGSRRSKLTNNETCDLVENTKDIKCVTSFNSAMIMESGSPVLCEGEYRMEQVGILYTDALNGSIGSMTRLQNKNRRWVRNTIFGNKPGKQVCNWPDLRCGGTDQCVPLAEVCDGIVDCVGSVDDESIDTCGNIYCGAEWLPLFSRVDGMVALGDIDTLVHFLSYGGIVKAQWKSRLIEFAFVRVYNRNGSLVVVGQQKEADFSAYNAITITSDGFVRIETIPLVLGAQGNVYEEQNANVTWLGRNHLSMTNLPTKTLGKSGVGLNVVTNVSTGIYDTFPGSNTTGDEILVSFNPNLLYMKRDLDYVVGYRKDQARASADGSTNFVFLSYSTMGIYNGLHWNISTASAIANIYKITIDEQHWFVDHCWELAYSHDSKGNPVEGSLRVLRKAITAGHKVRVVLKRKSFEPDVIRIRNGNVSAHHIRITQDELGEFFVDRATLVFLEAATTGRVQQVSFDETYNLREERDVQRPISWYVEKRHWSSVARYNFNKTEISRGSFDAIQDAFNSSKDARVSIAIDDYELYYTVGRFAGTYSSNALAMTVVPDGPSEFTWSRTPYYSQDNFIVTQQAETVTAKIETTSLQGTAYNTTQLEHPISQYIEMYVSG